LVKVTCDPLGTVMFCGDTPVLLMVIVVVFDVVPPVGDVVDDEPLPHEITKAAAAAAATPAAKRFRLRIMDQFSLPDRSLRF
jgi:hypothetical protein